MRQVIKEGWIAAKRLTRSAGMVRSWLAMAVAARDVTLGFLRQDLVPCFLLRRDELLKDAAGSWRRINSFSLFT